MVLAVTAWRTHHQSVIIDHKPLTVSLGVSSEPIAPDSASSSGLFICDIVTAPRHESAMD